MRAHLPPLFVSKKRSICPCLLPLSEPRILRDGRFTPFLSLPLATLWAISEIFSKIWHHEISKMRKSRIFLFCQKRLVFSQIRETSPIPFPGRKDDTNIGMLPPVLGRKMSDFFRVTPRAPLGPLSVPKTPNETPFSAPVLGVKHGQGGQSDADLPSAYEN